MKRVGGGTFKRGERVRNAIHVESVSPHSTTQTLITEEGGVDRAHLLLVAGQHWFLPGYHLSPRLATAQRGLWEV